MLAVARPMVHPVAGPVTQPVVGPPSPLQQQQLSYYAPAPGYAQQPTQYAYPQYPQAVSPTAAGGWADAYQQYPAAAPPQLQQYQQHYAPAAAKPSAPAQPPAVVGRSQLKDDVECAKAGVFCGHSNLEDALNGKSNGGHSSLGDWWKLSSAKEDDGRKRADAHHGSRSATPEQQFAKVFLRVRVRPCVPRANMHTCTCIRAMLTLIPYPSFLPPSLGHRHSRTWTRSN